jgi:hypothetical protein
MVPPPEDPARKATRAWQHNTDPAHNRGTLADQVRAIAERQPIHPPHGEEGGWGPREVLRQAADALEHYESEAQHLAGMVIGQRADLEDLRPYAIALSTALLDDSRDWASWADRRDEMIDEATRTVWRIAASMVRTRPARPAEKRE